MDLDLTPASGAALVVAAIGAVIAFYLAIPWLVYVTQKMTGDPVVREFDEARHRLPKRTARYFQDAAESLLGLGFEPCAAMVLPDPMPDVSAITRLWIHPERRDAVLVTAIYGHKQLGLQVHYSEFLSRFNSTEVSVIQTNNAKTISAFPDLPNELTFRFPQVKSILALDRLHREIVKQHAPPRAKKIVSLTDTFDGDLERYIRWVLVDSYRKQEGTGYLRRIEDENCWRPTVKGAYLMTWSQLFPMSLILKARIHRRARQLITELNVDEDADD